MHQASVRALAPLRSSSTRSWASSRAAGSWAARALSERAQFSTTTSTAYPRPCGTALTKPLVSRPITAAYSSDSRGPVKYEIDRKHEKEVAKQKLEVRPDEVSADSSVRPIIEHSQNPEAEKLPSVSEALGKDLHAAKDAIALTEVPREAYALGLSGTIPYFFTSLSTVFLGWNIRSGPSTSPVTNSFMLSPESAQQMLQWLEPIQLGYGAVIISSLGAVHWGMELMEKTPEHDRTRFRYAMGMLAPAVAWPTLFLPVHFALTGQFLAFTMLYFADSRAAKLGWTPQWYSTYRFVLTAVVGSAILVSLLFRAKIDDVGENMTQRLETGMHQRGPTEEQYSPKWARLEKKEKERIKAEEEEKKKEEEKAKKAEKKGGKSSDKSSKKEKSEEKDEKPEEKGEKKDNDEDKKEENKDDKKDDDAKGEDEAAAKDDKKAGKKAEKKDKDDSKSSDNSGDKTQKKGNGDEVKTDGDASSKKKSSKGDEEAKSKDEDGDSK